MLSHAVAACAQDPTDRQNHLQTASQFDTIFEQTDLSPSKPVCSCWVSQNELMEQLESKSFERGLPVPARDSFTHPTNRSDDTEASVARSNQQPNRGLLQPIPESDQQADQVRRIPRPIRDGHLRRASFQEYLTAQPQIVTPQLEGNSPLQGNPQLQPPPQQPAEILQPAETQQPAEVQQTPAEPEESLIPDDTTLEKLESQIKEQIELISKEAGDETLKQEQLQQLNTANSWIQKANNYQSLIKAQKKLEASFEARLKRLQADLDESPVANIPDQNLDSESLQLELQEKRQLLQQKKTELSENQRKMEERDKRIEQLPADRSAAEEKLSKSEKGLADLDQQPDGTSKQLSTMILEAKQWAAKKEIEALSIESPRQEESGRLLPLQRSVLSREIQNIESEIQLWNTAYNSKRDQEIVDQANDAERLRQKVVNSDPGLNAWAQLNHELVVERKNWTDGIEQAQSNLKDVTAEREKIAANLNTLTQATQDDITTEVGISLVEQRHSLAMPWESQARIQTIRSKLKHIRLQNLGWQEERQTISSVDKIVEELFMDRHQHGLSIQEFKSLAHQLVESRVKLLDDLNEDYEVFRDVLVKEDNERVSLIKKITEMQKFIDEKALWIQSANPIWEDPIGKDSDLLKSLDGFSSLCHSAKWTDFSGRILQRVTSRPSESALVGLVLVSLFVVSQRLRETS